MIISNQFILTRIEKESGTNDSDDSFLPLWKNQTFQHKNVTATAVSGEIVYWRCRTWEIWNIIITNQLLFLLKRRIKVVNIVPWKSVTENQFNSIWFNPKWFRLEVSEKLNFSGESFRLEFNSSVSELFLTIPKPVPKPFWNLISLPEISHMKNVLYIVWWKSIKNKLTWSDSFRFNPRH